MIDRPIFIVSPPRCGTSVLYRLIGDHSDVGYFMRADVKFPNHPALAHFITRSGMMNTSKKEAGKIWNRYCGAGAEFKSAMGREDASGEMRKWYENRIARLLDLQQKTRFAAKLPLFALRVDWLNQIFPTGIFIQILRDWRPAIASAMEKSMNDSHGRKRPGPWEHTSGKWFGLRAPLPEGSAIVGTPEVEATQHFLAIHDLLDETAERYSDRYLRVWYEDFCEDGGETLREVFRFAGLELTGEREAASLAQLRPLSDKWTSVLPPEIIGPLREAFGDALVKRESPRVSGY